MRMNRLFSTFSSNVEYWRLILFLIEVAIIIGASILILTPQQTYSGGNFVITPYNNMVGVDYGQSPNLIVYPAAGSQLLNDLSLDELVEQLAR